MMRPWIAALLALAACTTDRAATPSATPAPVPLAALAPEPLGPSLYDLDVRLRDSTGAAIGIDVARGHRVVLSMFYASCPVACPVLLAELGRIADELPADSDVRIVAVSFDPRDTPAALAALARERHLDARWTLATAGEVDARTLAAVIGFKYRKLDSGEYFHSSTIVALDPEGRPVAKTERIGAHEALVAALR